MRTTSSQWLCAMAETFGLMGLPVRALLKDANIPLVALAQPGMRIPQDHVSAFWQAAEAHCGDPCLGLRVGQQMSLSTAPLMAVGLLECTSAEAALKWVLRYQTLIGETANFRLVPLASGTQWRLDCRFYDDQRPLTDHTLDAAMASMVRVVRMVCGPLWRPKRVLLRRQPQDLSPYQQYYGCQ